MKSNNLKKQFFKKNRVWFIATMAVTLILSCGNLAISWLLQEIIDVSSGASDDFTIFQLALITLLLIGGLVLFEAVEYLAKPRFMARAMKQYKNHVFEELTKKSINAFNKENTALYISALSNDATVIETKYLEKSFSLVQNIFMFVGAFAMMLWYSPLLTLIAVLLSILPLVASLAVGGKMAVAEKQVSDKNEGFIETLKESLTGFSVIKSFKAEREILKLFAKKNKDAEDAKARRTKINIIITTIGMVAGVIAQMGVFLVGAYLATKGYAVTSGVVMVFVQLMNFVIGPIGAVPEILAGRKAAKALMEKHEEAIYANVRNEGLVIEKELKDGIELKNMSFSYEDGSDILNDINLKFEKGKSYAIVGSSGSGKSTLLNMLMAGNEAYEGDILYDGKELREINGESLYDMVSMVQQNVFVFNSSIRDNVTMFRDFDEAEINTAIEKAGLKELAEERGEDYVCGENGNQLSGGEKQRISIARCLLKKSNVLLIDEATAALDNATALSIENAILDIDDVTKIVVTHRFNESIMQKYDEIIVLNNGKVAEKGSFEKLMREKGYFYSLYMISRVEE